LGWLGLRGFISYSSVRNWPYALICASLAMIPVVLAALIVRDVRNEIRSQKARYGRVSFTFTEEGVSGADAAGFAFTDSWSWYDGFYVGRTVIVCPRVGSPMSLRIPTEDLPASRREEVRSLLSRHLSELSREALRARTESC
jgi:hypothetical protein